MARYFLRREYMKRIIGLFALLVLVLLFAAGPAFSLDIEEETVEKVIIQN